MNGGYSNQSPQGGYPSEQGQQQQQQQQQPNYYYPQEQNPYAQQPSGYPPPQQQQYPPPPAAQKSRQNPVDNSPVAQPAYYDYTVPQKFDDVHELNGSEDWATSMCKAPCNNTCMCLVSFFCPWCCVFAQRRELLQKDWNRYICCAGLCGSCFTCGCCRTLGPCCMALETVFCLSCAVFGNRFMVMQHYNLRSECCDIVIMYASCILSIIGAILGNDWVSSVSQCLYCIVLSCILSQNDLQMKTFGYPRGCFKEKAPGKSDMS